MRMPRPRLLAFLALLPQPAVAQGMLLSTAPLTEAHGKAGRALGSRTEFALDVGIIAGAVSFARRVGDSRLSVGAGIWGAWEPPNSFDWNVWEPIGLVLFGRYRPASWLHTDLGLTAARYVWADDCSNCSGTFVGVRSVVLAGYRFLFLGPELSVGSASDDQHGSDVGLIWGAQLRLLLGGAR